MTTQQQDGAVPWVGPVIVRADDARAWGGNRVYVLSVQQGRAGHEYVIATCPSRLFADIIAARLNAAPGCGKPTSGLAEASARADGAMWSVGEPWCRDEMLEHELQHLIDRDSGTTDYWHLLASYAAGALRERDADVSRLTAENTALRESLATAERERDEARCVRYRHQHQWGRELWLALALTSRRVELRRVWAEQSLNRQLLLRMADCIASVREALADYDDDGTCRMTAQPRVAGGAA